MIDWIALRDAAVGLAATGTSLWGGYWAVRRMIGTDKRVSASDGASVAVSDATTGVIERLERHLREADERTAYERTRADKAERERNEALNKLGQLDYTIQSLRDEVKQAREETRHAREEVQTLRGELQKYAKQ